jgi:hypothetical protein
MGQLKALKEFPRIVGLMLRPILPVWVEMICLNFTTCLGEGPTPVSRVPRVGAMPELITYQCPACGHVETIEKQPNTLK